ncbi:calcium-responsive transcription factor isoform X1 [Carassius carassius]|uniref:calcium-responsive transcription factor isoform X1 n=1 Tax=Carassius carassius TaxID=217509 RepID=UPI0028694A37|nr:calcium-responsive transcription factor isoform X1 [Carassius carassius]XP_059355767.1 calcium-responsive transcription factor isoform X1 [Carassius carassius]XP_059355768.1 calcium-responsive transcription factor isoform X1 [Carassius carassius]
MEEEERDVEGVFQSEEREDGLQCDKNPKAEENATVQELAPVIPASETEAANQKPPTVPMQMDNLIIVDQNGQPIQYDRLVIVTGGNGPLYGVPSVSMGAAQMLLPHGQLLNVAKSSGVFVEKRQQTITSIKDSDGTHSVAAVAAQNVTDIKIQRKSPPDVFEPPVKPLPPGAPNWALRLRRCEKIGDSYRGYCNTEAELEAILLLHKQQTHSVFGTRQSPSPAKPATRLMWKSQYVPYDGIPFVNAGSRAIVMECQFGPRRKGVQPKKGSEQETNQNILYKATCPARIYIKKVRKFLEYKVPTDPKVDKKVVRQEQEKAFFNLKKTLWDVGGIVRYYIQLPTENAHLYHDMDTADLPPLPEQICFTEEQQNEEEDTEELDVLMEDGTPLPSRLHPLVAEKICELVAQGHNEVYTVRKQLRYDFDAFKSPRFHLLNNYLLSRCEHPDRRFVEREMFRSEEVPERHNLCFFPTVIDIKNHIHEAQKALQMTTGPLATSDTEWKADANNLLPETLTLALTPATVGVSSQKEGLLEGSDTLSPEAVQLFSSLSSLQPKIFAHLQAIQLQPALCPVEETVQPTTAPAEAQELSSPAPPQPVLLSPSHFLQSSPSAGESTAACDGMSQLVNVASAAEGDITQILLEDGQAIPVQVVEPASITLSPSADQTPVK